MRPHVLTVLSPSYLDEKYLSGGARASHNTFMTMVSGSTEFQAGFFYVAVLPVDVLRLVCGALLAQILRGHRSFFGDPPPAVAVEVQLPLRTCSCSTRNMKLGSGSRRFSW